MVVMLPVVALVLAVTPVLELLVRRIALLGTPPNSSPRTTILALLFKVTVIALELPPLIPIAYQSSTLPVLPD